MWHDRSNSCLPNFHDTAMNNTHSWWILSYSWCEVRVTYSSCTVPKVVTCCSTSASALTWRGECGKAACTHGRLKIDKTPLMRAINTKSQWYEVPFCSLNQNHRLNTSICNKYVSLTCLLGCSQEPLKHFDRHKTNNSSLHQAQPQLRRPWMSAYWMEPLVRWNCWRRIWKVPLKINNTLDWLQATVRNLGSHAVFQRWLWSR